MEFFKSFFLVICCLLELSKSSESKYYCIDNKGGIQQCPGNVPPNFNENISAYAKYANRINETGWAELELVTNEQLKDEVQSYYAGYLEGFITSKLIKSHVHNLLPDQQERCDTLGKFIEENFQFTMNETQKKFDSDRYWHEVSLTYYQLAGIDDGFKQAINNNNITRSPHNQVDPCGLFLLNLHSEFSELDRILNLTSPGKHEDHCSAIIKILPDNNDILTAHNTWGNPRNMLRVFKRYTLHFSTSTAKSVAMSSYPGVIFSFDDYYITSQNLVVQETTNANFNEQLWSSVEAGKIVFEFIRNIIANRLASNGNEWSAVFMEHNSGTYNNQFMIVDYKRFENKTIKPGFLTILEQFPGQVIYGDLTEILIDQGYWSSYNVPYFHTMYLLGKWDIMIDKFGDHFDYDLNARSQIFDRDQVKVINMTTLFHLMRYNDFRRDPLSKCNCTPPYTADNAIAARNDLNDPKGRYEVFDYTFRPSLAYDAKMTSSELVKDMVSVAVSGPTDENVEPFDWSTTKLSGLLHLDQPTLWKFKPIITRWELGSKTFPNFEFDF